MDEGIARANITHLKTLLATEPDAAKRKVLLDILTEEERKLAAALERKRKKD